MTKLITILGLTGVQVRQVLFDLSTLPFLIVD
jgi:hypothetical protein